MLTALLAVSSSAYAGSTIGIVSLERILRDAPAARRAQDKIREEFVGRDRELSAMAGQLKRMQNELLIHAVTMSDADRQTRERAVEEMDLDYRRKQREFSDELNRRRDEALAPVLADADRAVRRIAESGHYDIIVRKAVWASPAIDITDRVMEALGDGSPAAK